MLQPTFDRGFAQFLCKCLLFENALNSKDIMVASKNNRRGQRAFSKSNNLYKIVQNHNPKWIAVLT